MTEAVSPLPTASSESVADLGAGIMLVDGSTVRIRFTFYALALLEDKYGSIGKWSAEFAKALDLSGPLHRIVGTAVWACSAKEWADGDAGLQECMDSLDPARMGEYVEAVDAQFVRAWPALGKQGGTAGKRASRSRSTRGGTRASGQASSRASSGT